jgi:subtilisin family serine protease
VFEHIRKEGRIIKTWDFTRGKEFVYSYNTHGTMVMSCIGGIVNGIKIGLATGAEYMLARTEVNAEKYSEEENWLAAVEWADRNGADIINSSLGYTYHRYYPEQMDGRTTLATRAAELAAKKGILVVNAAGNDGMTRWQGIGAPADADSILSVGGIDPKTDYHINFSSYGPTADKRLKPNVCSYGQVMACGRRGMQKVEGTSFASPLVAGFAACAWQKKREMTNTELLHEIEKSADMYPYFDYAHGYGVPQADYFVNNGNIDAPSATFDFIKEDLTLKVVIKDEFIKESGNNILYYNIEDGKGVLKKYYVVSVTEKEPVTLKISDFKKGEKINVLYKHYTSSCEL